MSDHPLNESFETTGHWHLPEEPDRKIAGNLSYTSNGTTLDLYEPFQAVRGTLRTSDTPQEYPIIHGTTRSGEAVTLTNAVRAGGTFNFGSGGLRESERVFTVWSIVGAHLPAKFHFPRVTFRIPGLQVWLSRQTIEDSHSRDETTRETTILYRVRGWREELHRIDTIDATVGWGTSRRATSDPFTSVSVTVSGWLIVEPREPMPIEWYIDQQSKVTTMLAFLAGTPMSPDLIEASVDESTHRVSILVALRDAKYCSYKSLSDFFMPRSAMGIDLFEALKKWFAIYEKIDKPSQLALSVFGSEKLWLHIEFLSLIQALEGFHRGLIDGNYMPDADYESVKKALGDAIPAAVGSDHRAALRSRIRYGNQYSLQKRLSELADRLSDPIRLAIFGQLSKVPRQWVDTRNFYTHWDEALSADILNGAGMYYANVRMRHFLRALYLDLMGIPQTAILKSLSNGSDPSQHLIQLNAAERRATNPDDMSGVYARISEHKPSTSTAERASSQDVTDSTDEPKNEGSGPGDADQAPD